MYGYYLLSSIGIRQVAFVKKYITMIQMTQFCLLMLQGFYHLLKFPKYPAGVEPYPDSMSWIGIMYMLSMLMLFGHFYVQDRLREQKKAK